MNRSTAPLVLAVILTVLQPEATLADGILLLKQCTPIVSFLDNEGNVPSNVENTFAAGFCLGMAQGITNMNLAYQYTMQKTLFCLPTGGIQNSQAVRVIVKYLKEHPEQLHEQEGSLAIIAFIQAFPCPP